MVWEGLGGANPVAPIPIQKALPLLGLAARVLDESVPPMFVMIVNLVRSLTGEAVLTSGHGSGMLVMELAESETISTVVSQCARFAPPELQARFEDGRCKFTVRVPEFDPIEAEAWVDGNRLRVGAGSFRQPPPANRDETVDDLLAGNSLVSFWGSGSGIPGTRLDLMRDLLTEKPAQQLPTGLLAAGIWSLFHISEFGFSTTATDRGFEGTLQFLTTYENPAEVIDGFEKAMPDVVAGTESGRMALAALAKAHPRTPFGDDYHAGSAGMMPAAFFAVLPAVAIPAFMKYIKKSKTTEARVYVKSISQSVDAYRQANGGALPAPSSGLTPPAGSCCGGPKDKCMPNPELWNKEPWTSIGFSVVDPHYYSYEYQKLEGKDANKDTAYLVRAIGDLDCDGVFSTFEMYGATDPSKAADSMYKENELE